MFVEFDKNPNQKKLKEFGLTFSFIFFLLALFIYRSKIFDSFEIEYKFIFLLIIGNFVSLALLKPHSLKGFYIFWNYLGAFIGLIVGPIALAIFYFGVVTPIGLFSRLTGKVWLETEKQDSYWVPLESQPKEQFEKLY